MRGKFKNNQCQFKWNETQAHNTSTHNVPFLTQLISMFSHIHTRDSHTSKLFCYTILIRLFKNSLGIIPSTCRIPVQLDTSTGNMTGEFKNNQCQFKWNETQAHNTSTHNVTLLTQLISMFSHIHTRDSHTSKLFCYTILIRLFKNSLGIIPSTCRIPVQLDTSTGNMTGEFKNNQCQFKWNETQAHNTSTHNVTLLTQLISMFSHIHTRDSHTQASRWWDHSSGTIVVGL